MSSRLESPEPYPAAASNINNAASASAEKSTSSSLAKKSLSPSAVPWRPLIGTTPQSVGANAFPNVRSASVNSVSSARTGGSNRNTAASPVSNSGDVFPSTPAVEKSSCASTTTDQEDEIVYVEQVSVPDGIAADEDAMAEYVFFGGGYYDPGFTYAERREIEKALREEAQHHEQQQLLLQRRLSGGKSAVGGSDDTCRVPGDAQAAEGPVSTNGNSNTTSRPSTFYASGTAAAGPSFYSTAQPNGATVVGYNPYEDEYGQDGEEDYDDESLDSGEVEWLEKQLEAAENPDDFFW